MLTARPGRRTGAGSAPAGSVGGGSASASAVPSSMVGIIPPLLQLGHCSGTTPGLVTWLSPYLWSWNSNGRNMATPSTVACRKTQGASVLGIASFPQTTREIHVSLMLGSLCVPLCQLLLSPSFVLQVHEHELLCRAALPSPHGRVGGPGVGTGGWGQSRACTGVISAGSSVGLILLFLAARAGWGLEKIWPGLLRQRLSPK